MHSAWDSAGLLPARTKADLATHRGNLESDVRAVFLTQLGDFAGEPVDQFAVGQARSGLSGGFLGRYELLVELSRMFGVDAVRELVSLRRRCGEVRGS